MADFLFAKGRQQRSVRESTWEPHPSTWEGERTHSCTYLKGGAVVGSVAAQWQSGPNWQKSQVGYWHAHGVVASACLAHAAKWQSSSNVISFKQAVHSQWLGSFLWLHPLSHLNLSKLVTLWWCDWKSPTEISTMWPSGGCFVPLTPVWHPVISANGEQKENTLQQSQYLWKMFSAFLKVRFQMVAIRETKNKRKFIKSSDNERKWTDTTELIEKLILS